MSSTFKAPISLIHVNSVIEIGPNSSDIAFAGAFI